MSIFNSEVSAVKYFKDVPVEQCEVCKRWSASAADHDRGEIIGPICTEDGRESIYDRVCEMCHLRH